MSSRASSTYVRKLVLQVGQGVLHASSCFSLHLHLEAVLFRVDERHREVIPHIVELIGGDEPRIEEELGWRFSIERAGTVDDEDRESRGFLRKREYEVFLFFWEGGSMEEIFVTTTESATRFVKV